MVVELFSLENLKSSVSIYEATLSALLTLYVTFISKENVSYIPWLLIYFLCLYRLWSVLVHGLAVNPVCVFMGIHYAYCNFHVTVENVSCIPYIHSTVLCVHVYCAIHLLKSWWWPCMSTYINSSSIHNLLPYLILVYLHKYDIHTSIVPSKIANTSG